jgi:phosphohistidine phosphatase SixA
MKTPTLRRLFGLTAKIVQALLIFLVAIASLLTVFENREGIRSTFSALVKTEDPQGSDQFWAKRILDGGYILYFRHAERDKYLDVFIYDLLESNFPPRAEGGYRLGDKDYFSGAVCLNDRGLIQARAIGEILNDIALPIESVVVSPSCRARQTASIAFGGFDKIAPVLVHRGPYKEDFAQHKAEVGRFLAQLSVASKKNTVVIAHNDVIDREIFSNSSGGDSKIYLEEGGFAVISKNSDGTLKLEHEFTNFATFSLQHFERPKG